MPSDTRTPAGRSAGVPRVFVDTAYFVARIDARDSLHDRAVALSRSILESHTPVTSELVLTEFLGFVAKHGPVLRAAPLGLVDRAVEDMEIVRSSHDLFNDGVRIYRQFRDKGYSLVDCSSFLIMRRRRITLALTSDHHFAERGFVPLLA